MTSFAKPRRVPSFLCMHKKNIHVVGDPGHYMHGLSGRGYAKGRSQVD